MHVPPPSGHGCEREPPGQDQGPGWAQGAALEPGHCVWSWGAHGGAHPFPLTWPLCPWWRQRPPRGARALREPRPSSRRAAGDRGTAPAAGRAEAEGGGRGAVPVGRSARRGPLRAPAAPLHPAPPAGRAGARGRGRARLRHAEPGELGQHGHQRVHRGQLGLLPGQRVQVPPRPPLGPCWLRPWGPAGSAPGPLLAPPPRLQTPLPLPSPVPAAWTWARWRRWRRC